MKGVTVVMILVLCTSITASKTSELSASTKPSTEDVISEIVHHAPPSSRQAGYGLVKFEDQDNRDLDQNKYGFFEPDSAGNRPFKFDEQPGDYPVVFDGNNGAHVNVGNSQAHVQGNIVQTDQNPQKKKKKRRKRKPRVQQFPQYQGYPRPGFPQGDYLGYTNQQEPYPYQVPSGYPGSFMYRPVRRSPPSTWATVVDTLTALTANDDYQCLPMLVCQAAARGAFGNSSLPFFSPLSALLATYGSLSLSPVVVFGRAAVLGMAARSDPDACAPQYPRCPTDPQELVYYLNNYKGGFFRYFNSPGIQQNYQLPPSAQNYQPPGQNYPNTPQDFFAQLAPQLQNIQHNYGLYNPNLQYPGQRPLSPYYGFHGRNTHSPDVEDDEERMNIAKPNHHQEKDDEEQFQENNTIERRSIVFDTDESLTRSRRSAQAYNYQTQYSAMNQYNPQQQYAQAQWPMEQPNGQYSSSQWQQQPNQFQITRQALPQRQTQQISLDHVWPVLNATSNTWYYPNVTKSAGRTAAAGFPDSDDDLNELNLGQVFQAIEHLRLKDDRHCLEQLVCELTIKNKAHLPKQLLTEEVFSSLPHLLPTYGAAMKYGFEHMNKSDDEVCARHYPDCPQDKARFFFYMNHNRGGISQFLKTGKWDALYNNIVDDIRNQDPGENIPVLQDYKTPLRQQMEAQNKNSYQKNFGQPNSQNELYSLNQYAQVPQLSQHINQQYYGAGSGQQQPTPYDYQSQALYNNYQQNYYNPQYRRLNYELDPSKNIQRRIQNHKTVFAEDIDNLNYDSKWKFPEVVESASNVRGGRELRFPTRDTKTDDVIRKAEGFLFPGAQSNRDYLFAQETEPSQDNDISSNGYFTNLNNQGYEEDYGVQIVYIVRGNGDPNHPEIVRLRPGEKLMRK